MPSGATRIAGAGGTPNCTPAAGGGPAASAGGGPASCSSGGGPAGGGASCTDGMLTGGWRWIVVDELAGLQIGGGGLLAIGACACC